MAPLRKIMRPVMGKVMVPALHRFGGGDAIAPLLSTIEVGAVADNKIVLTYAEALDE